MIPNKTNSEADECKMNMENIKNELAQLILHKDVLEKKIDNCRKIFESKIIVPSITRNLASLGQKDLNIDLVPISYANKEQVEARYEFYHLSNERADIMIAIEAKKNLYYEYQEHLKQYFDKQAIKITDEMIYTQLTKAQDLVMKLSPEEKKTLEGLISELPKRLNSDKDTRRELYEALQNLVLQHG
jgi:hypothetical protein